MCIFTYKLLCGTIFIPFAVHRPMNPPFIGRCTLLWMVRCCRERHACGLVPVRWRHSAASYRPMKGMQRQVMFFTFRWIFLSGHACGLVPVRMHYPCPMNPPFIGRCTLFWMVRCCRERHACGLVPVRMHPLFLENLLIFHYKFLYNYNRNMINRGVPCRWLLSDECLPFPMNGGDSSDGAPRKEWK